MVEEGEVVLGAKGVDVAPWTQRWRLVIVNIDAKGVNKGFRAVVVAKADRKTPPWLSVGGDELL